MNYQELIHQAKTVARRVSEQNKAFGKLIPAMRNAMEKMGFVVMENAAQYSGTFRLYYWAEKDCWTCHVDKGTKPPEGTFEEIMQYEISRLHKESAKLGEAITNGEAIVKMAQQIVVNVSSFSITKKVY